MKRSLSSFLAGDIRRQPAPSKILSGGRSQAPRSGRAGFTLVELLAVIAILAILMGMGVGAFTFAQRRISDTNTRTLIKQLEIGLEAHHQKHGYYPQNHQAASATENIYFVHDDSPTPTRDHLYAIREWVNYEEIKTKNMVNGSASESTTSGRTTLAAGSTEYVTDAYGSPLIYRCPGLVNKASYDLGSKGPDAKWGDGTTNGPHYNSSNAFRLGGGISTYVNTVFGLGDDITNIAR